MKLHETLPLSLWGHRRVTWLLAKRELEGRFTGSLLGRVWMIISPLILLGVYAFFFGEVLQARWVQGDAGEDLTSFALIIFTGLMLHQIFADGITRSPDLLIANPNYVKKVIFPLEILPLVVLMTSQLQLLISTAILLVVLLCLGNSPYWTWLLLPLIYVPFSLATLGIMWVLAALGVFMRDLKQVTQFVATVTIFASPVFYSMDKLPDSLDFLRWANPLVIAIEQSRRLIFEGLMPEWNVWGLYTLASLLGLWIGYYFFKRTQPAFADVL